MSRPDFNVKKRMGALLALLCLGSFGATGAAQEEERSQVGFGDAIHVVQPKPVLQKKRFDLAPRLGVTVNDAVYRNVMVGATGHFHVTEHVFAGGLVQWYGLTSILGGGTTQTYADVNAQTTALVDAPYLNWAAGAEVGFVPLFGKFAFFNRSVIFYDVSITLGATYGNAASVASPLLQESNLGGTASLTSRFFINDWMALNLEVRDVIYQARFSGLSGTTLSHSVTTSLGLSIYLPTSFEYTESVGQR